MTEPAVVEVEEQEEGQGTGLTGTLTLEAPDGASFEMEPVRTKGGDQSLGDVPILVWNNLDRAREHYGDEGIVTILDGTSLRVSFQSISRRHALASKTFDECAQAQINFKPGKRVVGESTPVSRARSAAGKAANRLGDKADNITSLLERIARGEISDELKRELGITE